MPAAPSTAPSTERARGRRAGAEGTPADGPTAPPSRRAPAPAPAPSAHPRPFGTGPTNQRCADSTHHSAAAADQDQHHHGRVVDGAVVPCEVGVSRDAGGRERQHEVHADDHGLEHGHRTHPPVVAPERPRARHELVPLAPAEIHGDDVRDVQAERRRGRERQECDGNGSALPYSAGSVKIAPATATASAAFTGAWLALTFDHIRCPGTARSRENAYMTRLPAVSAEPPQKNWPTTLMIITALNSDTDNDDAKTAIESRPRTGSPARRSCTRRAWRRR